MFKQATVSPEFVVGRKSAN